MKTRARSEADDFLGLVDGIEKIDVAGEFPRAQFALEFQFLQGERTNQNFNAGSLDACQAGEQRTPLDAGLDRVVPEDEDPGNELTLGKGLQQMTKGQSPEPAFVTEREGGENHDVVGKIGRGHPDALLVVGVFEDLVGDFRTGRQKLTFPLRRG